jgi:hypothetical protein
MNTQELLEQIHSVLEVLTAEHAKPAKAAKGRARKAAGELKKLAGEYRKTSVAEGKAQ